MSHADLLERGVPITDRAHQELALDRFQSVKYSHRRRIQNLEFDRKLISGEIWNSPPKDGERRVTVPIGDDIAQVQAALLLPDAPRISVMPTSQQDPESQKIADSVQQFVYGMLDSTRGIEAMQEWAMETIVAGVGAMHTKADKWAIGNEVPLLFNVPDSAGLLYHTNERRDVDYIFIKHLMTADEMRRDLKAQPRGRGMIGTQSMKYEVWCYYTEERLEQPDGSTALKVFYTVMQDLEFLYTLIDITDLWPRIPVQLAFTRGYTWTDREDMKARGALTSHESLIAYYSDYFSLMANNNLNYVNPAMIWVRDPGRPADDELDLTPGFINDAYPGETLIPALAGQTPKDASAFFQTLQQVLGAGTTPQVFNPLMNLEGVSGSALQEIIHPATLRAQMRQYSLQFAIRSWITLTLEHLSKVVPEEGLELFGVDPRDHKMFMAKVTPEVLARHLRINVELPSETPRDVIKYVTMLQGLMRDGVVPKSLGMEQIAQLLKLKVSDMSTMMELAAADDAYKAMLQGLQRAAQQLSPYLNQAQVDNNRQMNPNVLADGQRPPVLDAESQSPLDSAQQVPQVGPVQQQAAQLASVMGG